MEPKSLSNEGLPPPYELHDSSSVERLRRFLSVCLAIDYRLLNCTEDHLSREDMCYFIDLARRCFLPGEGAGPTYLNLGLLPCYNPTFVPNINEIEYTRDLDDTNPEVCEEIITPARSLGVPSTIVAEMLLTFVCSILDSKRLYQTSHKWYGRLSQRTTDVIWKLWLDKLTLYEAVLPQSNIILRDQFLRHWKLDFDFYLAASLRTSPAGQPFWKGDGTLDASWIVQLAQVDRSTRGAYLRPDAIEDRRQARTMALRHAISIVSIFETGSDETIRQTALTTSCYRTLPEPGSVTWNTTWKTTMAQQPNSSCLPSGREQSPCVVM